MSQKYRLPNVIIAGTNKAGTTSLYRYLSDHPDTCSSQVKEIGFFNKTDEPITREAWDQYVVNFRQCSENVKVVLEASPVYLSGGQRTARLIKQHVPEAKLIFILREQISRIVSNFTRRKERLDVGVKEFEFDEYIKHIFEELRCSEDKQRNKKNWVDELSTLDYATHLHEYIDIFPPAQIGVFFFDDLRHDAENFVKNVCKFINLDENYYTNSDYEFIVENKTRKYKSKRLQRYAFNVNMKLEVYLNKSPAFRRGLRSVYNRFNESPPEAFEIGDESTKMLNDHFGKVNIELKNVLKERFPELELPKWLN